MKFSRREFVTHSAMGALSLAALRHAKLFAGEVAPRKIADSPPPSLAVIALTRAGYGFTPESLEAFSKLGRTPADQFRYYVDQQLHPLQINDHICDDKLSNLKLATMTKSLPQLWADHAMEANRIRKDQKEGKADAEEMNQKKVRQLPAVEVEMATWTRAVYSERQLAEVLAEFWHDHFNVFAYEGNPSSVFTHYDRDVIRPHVFGNFRELLESVASSPAMLFYLDNFVNQSANPNENYARELFELHTLGAENYLGTGDRKKVPGFLNEQPIGYVDGDVYEAARCFTGWKVDTGKNSKETGTFSYVDSSHDRFQKIILGHSIPELQPPMKDGKKVLDILADHMGTARYVSRKLCRRLVSDQPSEKLVQGAAKLFHDHRKAKDQISQVVRFILLSPEFASTWGEKIKRPFESTVSLLRALSADFTPSEKFLNNYNRSGHRRFQWKTPDGYPDFKEKWASTTAWLDKWRLSNQLLHEKIDGIEIDLSRFNNKGLSPKQLAESWSQHLLGYPMQPAALSEVVDLLTHGPGGRELSGEAALSQGLQERLVPAVALIAMSPQFQWR
jgi:uncharacterized protein (DUF1800 family)